MGFAAVFLATLAVGASGHGWMTEPPSRAGATMAASGTCPYGTCLWFNQGCTIGCPKCGGVNGSPTCGKEQGKPTIPREARTYFDNPFSCGTNPWCAPGSAPIMNPCGVAGGDDTMGKPGNGGDPPPGYKQGFPGDKMPQLKDMSRSWKVGDAVDVAWAVTANHGGGYQYRLCPKGSEMTEECFQKTPMEFVSDQHEIQYCPYPAARITDPLPTNATPAEYPPDEYFPPSGCNKENRTKIPAMRVSKGTIPEGSTWMRNPIPACKAAAGGAFNIKCGDNRGHSPGDYQFPPAGPDLARPGFLLGGFGEGSCGGCSEPGNSPSFCGKYGPDGPNNCTIQEVVDHVFTFNVVDQVRVPQVTPGEYVLSFRWDCEQTPQIWAQCADVTITAGEEHIVV